MTRVLMTADTVGGVWPYALELADALAPEGVEVVLATMGRPMSSYQRDEIRSSAVVDVHESRFALEWMDDPWDDVDHASDWLLELEQRIEPDLVHLNGYAHGALSWSTPTVVVGHSCVVSWWEAVHGEPPPAEWDEYRRRVEAGLHAADVVVAPTAAMLAALRRAYGVRDGVVVPNGRRSDRFPPGPKEPLVLTAGRLWDEAKNAAAVDRVAAQLPAAVVIAGADDRPGGRGTWRARQARHLGPLPQPRLAGWMARASVFALPARYEPFGLAALEAGLAGCALALGDIPSLREVWGDAALFVDPDDDEALADALQTLLSDEPFREEMATRARCRAMEHRPGRTAAGYLAAYEQVISSAGATR